MNRIHKTLAAHRLYLCNVQCFRSTNNYLRCTHLDGYECSHSFSNPTAWSVSFGTFRMQASPVSNSIIDF